MKTITTLTLVLLAIFAGNAQKIPFQGKLIKDGEPITSTVKIDFDIASAGWAETHSSVSVIDGYYFVVLGSLTPFPDSLFKDTDEVQLGIQVNDTTLSPVTLYRPIVDDAPPIVTDTAGEFRGGINYNPMDDAGNISLEAGKSVATESFGYFRVDYKKLGPGGAPLFHLAAENSGAVHPVVHMGSRDVSPYFGIFELGGFDGEFPNDPTRIRLEVDSVGSLGSGGNLSLHGSTDDGGGRPKEMFSVRVMNDPGSPDPTGMSGEAFLWGTNSPNVEMGGKQWENNDMSYLRLYGSKNNGGGFFNSNIEMETASRGAMDFGKMVFFRTVDGGAHDPSIELSGDFNNTGAGGLNLFSSTNNNTISLEGDSGRFNAVRVELGNNGLDGGIFVKNAADQGVGVWDIVGGRGELKMSNNNFDSVTVSINSEGNMLAAAYNTHSDLRLKKNVYLLENSLEKIKKLRGVSFEWKSSGAKSMGFIAQELEEQYPSLVSDQDDGFKAVNYGLLVSALVEAIKELDQKVTSLQQENNELKTRLESSDIADLKKEIAHIKAMIMSAQNKNGTSDD